MFIDTLFVQIILLLYVNGDFHEHAQERDIIDLDPSVS